MASYTDYPGQISARAAAKRPGIFKQTRVQGANMEKFSGKQGLGDQGGADWSKPFDEGDTSIAGTKHIDTKQGGTVGRKVSKAGKHSSKPVQKVLRGTRDTGAGVGAEKQPIRKAQVDDAATQKPDFPKGAGYKKGWADKAGKTGYAKVPANKLAAWKGNSRLKD